MGLAVDWAVGLCGGTGGAMASVTITSPAPGTQLLVGINTVFSGLVVPGGPVSLYWGSDDAKIADADVTETAWSCDVTPPLSRVAETSVVARKVGSSAQAVLPCTFSADIEDYITAAGDTLLLGYRADTGVTHTTTVSAWAPFVGGTASDVLTQATPSKEPIYNESDAQMPGSLPSVQGTGSTKWMQSVTPASALQTSQPCAHVLVGVPPGTNGRWWVESAVGSTQRQYAGYRYSPNWRVYAGSITETTVAVDATQGALLATAYTTPTSSVRVRKADGTIQTASLGNAGTNTIRGYTLFTDLGFGTIGNAKLYAILCVSGGLSAQAWTNLQAWAIARGWL
jgi:hypothetical protein